VNGPQASQLFRYAKERLGGGDVQWNFEKFLFVDGEPVKRYATEVSPSQIITDIEDALAGRVVSSADIHAGDADEDADEEEEEDPADGDDEGRYAEDEM